MNKKPLADVAQLVEQLIRNQQVGGSTPPVGSKTFKGITVIHTVIPFFILNHISRQIKANWRFSATILQILFLVVLTGGLFSTF